jgi:hypothetical protein
MTSACSVGDAHAVAGVLAGGDAGVLADNVAYALLMAPLPLELELMPMQTP